MVTTDLAFAAILFFGIYFVTSQNDTRRNGKEEVLRASRSRRLSQLLTQFRMQGPNMKVLQDQTMELIRRGVPAKAIPKLGANGVDSLQEMAAQLQLLIEETPWAPNDNAEPGEDLVAANTGFQIWPRTLEEEAGEN